MGCNMDAFVTFLYPYVFHSFCLSQFRLVYFFFFPFRVSSQLVENSEEPSLFLSFSLLCVHAWVKFRTHILPMSSTATQFQSAYAVCSLSSWGKKAYAFCMHMRKVQWKVHLSLSLFLSLSIARYCISLWPFFMHFILLPAAPPSKIVLFFFFFPLTFLSSASITQILVVVLLF